jgi:hypothetical protein
MLTSEQKSYVLHLVAEQVSGKPGKDGARRTYDGLSKQGFADLIGRHINTLMNWDKMPEIQDAVKRGFEEVENSRDYFKVVMARHALEEMWVQYGKAQGAEKRQYLKMIRDETKDAIVDDSSADYSHKTDDELIDIYMNRDVSAIGVTVDELARLAKKEGDDE